MHFSKEDQEKLRENESEIYKKRTEEMEKEDLEKMGAKGKLRYFFDYYFKITLVVAVVVCALVAGFIKNLSRKPMDVLYVVIRHDVIEESKLEKFSEVLETYLKADKRIEQVTVELCPSDQKLQTYLFNEVADVVIMDEENFERWGNADYFYTAEENEEVSFYQEYEEKYRYRTQHITIDDRIHQDENGEITPEDPVEYNCALYLTDSDKYKQLTVGIKNPVIAISKVTKHKKNAVKFVQYMMDNGIGMELK